DLELIGLKTDESGRPVLLRDVANVAVGPEIRRGVSDLDGRGDAVGGIVVMRQGENARTVIERVKARLREVQPSLPKGARIAISIGVLVDGAIVEVENAYKKLELWMAGGRKGDFRVVRLEALMEVAPAVFFSLLVVAVAFLPIFTLADQEGRLFKPLAWTKN